MLIFKDRSGYEVYLDSLTPVITDAGDFEGWKKYQGFVVTHGETETISRFLGGNIICAFVFRTPPDATESLLKWKKEEAPQYVMMEGRNVQKGGDTIGVLLSSRTKKKRMVDRKPPNRGYRPKISKPYSKWCDCYCSCGLYRRRSLGLQESQERCNIPRRRWRRL